MKRFISIMLLFVLPVIRSNGQTAGDYPYNGGVTKSGLVVSIRDGKLMLNKTVISADWKLAPIVKELGSSGRVRPGYNITHSYDDLGLVAFETATGDNKDATGIVSEFQVYLSIGEVNNVSPTGYYSGDLIIEKRTISSNMSIEQIRSVLSNYKESQSYMSNSFRFSKDGLYMYVQFNSTNSSIQKISIGPDKRG